MKLKRYFEFIKESIKLGDKIIWKLSQDDIMEYFLDMKDEGWLIRIDFGFVFEKSDWSYVNGKYVEKKEDTFTELVLSGNEVETSYFIVIFKGKDVTNEDLTDSLLFAHDILKDVTGAREVKVLDEDGPVDINELLVSGGLFIGKDLNDEEQIEINNVSFFIKTGDKIELSQKEVADYYGWEYDKVDENGNIYSHVELEDMADHLLSRNSEYKEFLVKGIEKMWDYYEPSNYTPDIQSLFQYTLSKENEVLLLKSIIKESGGLEEIKRYIGDECDDNVYNNVKEMNEENLINYLLKERFYSTIKQLVVESSIYSDITETVADWEMSSHVDTNHDEIISEFDDIVGKEFEYERIMKEVTKKYKSKDSDGNEKIHEYKENVIFYELKFDNKWILEYHDYDADDLTNFKNIYDILYEYFGNGDFNYNMNPRISDWGNVDSKSLNSEISAILNKYLNK